jgi:hypothetical protein
MEKDEKRSFGISRYVGEFPSAALYFVQEFSGTYQEAIDLCVSLQAKHQDGEYRVWDCRD